jgi:hypothetical protein
MSIGDSLSSGVFRLPGPKARAMELRPMTLGEIFERAIALYARNFLSFVALVGVTIVPVAIAQYVVAVRQQSQLDAMIDLLAHPERLRTEQIPPIPPQTLAVTAASVLFGYVMLAFAFSAVAAGVARRYGGEAVSFRACYHAVLRRWLSVLGVVAMAVLVLLAAYVASIAVVAIPVFATAAFASSALPFLAPFVVMGMLFAVTFVLLLLVVTSSGALCAILVERCSTMSSVALASARALNRRELGRGLFCAFGVGVISLAASTVVDVAALVGLSRWPAAYVALGASERSVVVPFVATVLTVYYFDVRLRYQSFDLDAESELVARGDEPVYAPTAYLSGEERALIKRFLERRDSLTPQRRRHLAAALAAPVRERVPLEMRSLEDEPLLERL